MNMEEYGLIIQELKKIAESIQVLRTEGDGRIDSAIKETPFLMELKQQINNLFPDWDFQLCPPRSSCDFIVNGIRFNLKLTDCNSSDNCMNKASIFYSITGLSTYPYSSNWNTFLDLLTQHKKDIKTKRHQPTEYHYLVKNKKNGEILLKSIFDIHTYRHNPSNDLQINWKNEFIHRDYFSSDQDYPKKVQDLLDCIQRSVQEMIRRSNRFAYADMGSFFTQE